MNSISLMIYIADTVGRISGSFITAGVAAVIIAAILLIVGNVAWLDQYEKPEVREANRERQRAARKWGFRLAVFGPAIIFLASFLPSSTAIYMIAASEAGETVVTSPEAKEMLGDLKEIIRRKLKEELKDEVGI